MLYYVDDNTDKNCKENDFKVAIYGGNGFVGTHLAKELAAREVCTVCLSRSGHKPLHLKAEKWSESIRWCKGDANQPDAKLLSYMSAVVALVGSPPLPTFSKAAFEQQVEMNGITNAKAIKAAGDAGVKTVVLMGASIPLPMRSERFAYTKGKRIAYDAAKEFSELSDEHQAIVIQPGVIFGNRHLKSGKSIRLDWFMRPMSVIMPWQFVCVERLAKRVVDEILDTENTQSFKVIRNGKI